MATSVAKLTTVTWDAYVHVFAKVTLLTMVIVANNFNTSFLITTIYLLPEL
jgi:hypothetical protein